MRRLSVVLVLLVACGDDGSSGTADAPRAIDAAIDGAADASLDADPSIAPLVGTWLRAPEADPNTGFESITFHADGKTTTLNHGTTETGTFSVPAAGRVHLDPDGSGQTLDTDFVVGNNHLILTSFLPQGTTTGFVGTWRNQTTSGTTPAMTTSIDVRADHTATMMLGTTAVVGTWADESTGFLFTGTTPAVTFHFRPIGSQAIGYLLFVKS